MSPLTKGLEGLYQREMPGMTIQAERGSIQIGHDIGHQARSERERRVGIGRFV